MDILDASGLVIITIPAHNTVSIEDANGNELAHCLVTRPVDRKLDLSKKVDPASAAFPVTVSFAFVAEAAQASEEDVE